MAKKRYEKGMKILTINVSTLQLAFLDSLKDIGLVPSRSEAMRRFAMPYFYAMVKHITSVVNDTKNQKLIQQALSNFLVSKESVEKDIKQLGNIFWENRVIDGNVARAPTEPVKKEEEIYINGMGYVPVSRLKDLPDQNLGDVKWKPY